VVQTHISIELRMLCVFDGENWKVVDFVLLRNGEMNAGKI
jgi:hypothetical protein